jgi:hypothetical protein
MGGIEMSHPKVSKLRITLNGEVVVDYPKKEEEQ